MVYTETVLYFGFMFLNLLSRYAGTVHKSDLVLDLRV
jgi:hypothetical protein